MIKFKELTIDDVPFEGFWLAQIFTLAILLVPAVFIVGVIWIIAMLVLYGFVLTPKVLAAIRKVSGRL